MFIYVVGGAVRDRIMGHQPKDLDYVIVGATEDDIKDLLSRGFQQVGADFPVFLSPTGDEFALARTERKVGLGYHGFEVTFDSTVTLEDDLSRRDLTMNSMAVPLERWHDADFMDYLVDPFNGVKDIEDGVLRHTTEAFAEDPVRVLRLARFAARYQFTVAAETMSLCAKMVRDGELDALVGERVWKEFSRVLVDETNASMHADSTLIFIGVLMQCGAFQRVFPDSGLLENSYINDLLGMRDFTLTENAVLSAHALGYLHLLRSRWDGDVPVDIFAMAALLCGFSEKTVTRIKPTSASTRAFHELRDALPIVAKLFRMIANARFDHDHFVESSVSPEDILELTKIVRLRQRGEPEAVIDVLLRLMAVHRHAQMFKDDQYDRFEKFYEVRNGTEHIVRDFFKSIIRYYEVTDFDALTNKAKENRQNVGAVINTHAIDAFRGLLDAATTRQ